MRYGNVLKIGDELTLGVGIHPKTGKTCFIPEFVDTDEMSYFSRSVRLFNLTPCKNGFVFQEGEDWKVRIVGIDVSPPEIRTKDHRRKVFIEVEVIERDEHIEKEHRRSRGELHVVIKSGKRIIKEEKFPVTERKAAYRYRTGIGHDEERVVHFEEILCGKEIIMRSVIGDEPRGCYIKRRLEALKGFSIKRNPDFYGALPEIAEGNVKGMRLRT